MDAFECQVCGTDGDNERQIALMPVSMRHGELADRLPRLRQCEDSGILRRPTGSYTAFMLPLLPALARAVSRRACQYWTGIETARYGIRSQLCVIFCKPTQSILSSARLNTANCEIVLALSRSNALLH
ncbi:MAG: hypothetical protein V4446_10205 [Pseudomonadota bacterium]